MREFQGLMLRFQIVDDLLSPGKAKEALGKALERADQAIAEGRDSIHDLRSSTVLTNDLSRAVQALGDELGSQDSAQLAANPDYSTDTASNPNTQFQFYTSAPGLAMQVANQAISTVTGGPTVAISGFDGNPIPAIYAQGYGATNGGHWLPPVCAARNP